MYEKYDNPNVGDIRIEQKETILDRATEEIAPVTDILKANAKTIIAAIALLVVIYLAYDFFIGSYKTIPVSAADTEGNAINASLRVTDSSGGKIDVTGSQIRVKNGEYTFEAQLSGYKAKREKKAISDNTPITLTLEKDIAVEIDGTFPDTAFTGETLEVPINLTNNREEPQEIDLLFEGLGKEVTAAQSPEKIIAGAGETLPVTAILKINENGKAGAIKGKMRIKYTNESIPIEFTITKFSESDVTLDKSKIEIQKMSPVEQRKIDIKIKNKGKNTLRGLLLSIDLANASEVEKEKALNWFITEPEGTFEIGAGEETTVRVIIKAEITDIDMESEATEASLTGSIILKSSYLEKKIPLTVTVKKAKSELKVNNLNDAYSAQYNAATERYEAIDNDLELKNAGGINLEDIKIALFQCRNGSLSEPLQTTEYVNTTTTNWARITAGDSRNTTLVISISGVETPEKKFFCRMIISYKNPFFVAGENETSLTIEPEFVITTKKS